MEEYWDVFTYEPFISRLCDRVLCATDTPDVVMHLMIGILNFDGSDYNDSKQKFVIGRPQERKFSYYVRSLEYYQWVASRAY